MKYNHIDEELLKSKLRDRKITLVAEQTGLSRSTLYHWLEGRTILSDKSVAKLVNYLLSN
jgi:DNA-binding phage protein